MRVERTRRPARDRSERPRVSRPETASSARNPPRKAGILPESKHRQTGRTISERPSPARLSPAILQECSPPLWPAHPPIEAVWELQPARNQVPLGEVLSRPLV